MTMHTSISKMEFEMYGPSTAAATTPVNAPMLIKPAWPRLSSPRMPTVRLSDSAMMIYALIGTSCPLNERESSPPPFRTSRTMYTAQTLRSVTRFLWVVFD